MGEAKRVRVRAHKREAELEAWAAEDDAQAQIAENLKIIRAEVAKDEDDANIANPSSSSSPNSSSSDSRTLDSAAVAAHLARMALISKPPPQAALALHVTASNSPPRRRPTLDYKDGRRR